jgi:hypothetical protein
MGITWAAILIGSLSIAALALMYFGRGSFKRLPPSQTSEQMEEL